MQGILVLWTGHRVLNHRHSKLRNQLCSLEGLWFNPLVPSQQTKPLATLYQKNEREKRHAYKQRVQEVEYALFTPLVIAATGGCPYYFNLLQETSKHMGREARTAIDSIIMKLIRTRLFFSLLRSSILAIRGLRSLQ